METLSSGRGFLSVFAGMASSPMLINTHRIYRIAELVNRHCVDNGQTVEGH